MANTNLRFAFERRNYMMLLVGIGILIIGYILMSGGGSPDPNVFSEEIFSARRITWAPLIILIGYGFIGYAIMLKPKNVAPSAPETPATTKKK